MSFKSNHRRKDEIYSFLPPIDNILLKKRGIRNGHWIGLVGEPGSFKTVFTKWAIKKWIEYEDKNVAIYIATEENNRIVKKGFEDFGIDILKYKNEKKLIIGSVFCYQEDKDEIVQNSPNGVTQFVMKKIIEIGKHFQSLARVRIMLIIDSMASFWSHAPAMSRSIWSTIYGSLFHKIDIGLMTFQLSGTTHKAFGWGAEHGVDIIFRLGKYIENGEEHRYFIIDKVRGDKEDGRLFKSKIENNEFKIDGLISSKGKYASTYDAIIGMKYENDQNIQQERNDILKSLQQSIKKLTALTGLLIKNFNRSHNLKS